MVTRTHYSSGGAEFRIDFRGNSVQVKVTHDVLTDDQALRPWREFYKPILEEVAGAINDPATIWREPMSSS